MPRREDCDLRKEDQVIRLLDETHPTLVIHAAGLVGGIGANGDRPADFFFDNLLMGTLMLHHAHASGVEKFVNIGSTCSYPKNASVPFREEDLWNGFPDETNAPFGIAKRAVIEQACAYRAQYGFNAVTIMLANLYGPGDRSDLRNGHVIPVMIRKFLEAKQCNEQEVLLWGDGSPTRDFLYVEEAAQAVICAAERYDGSQPMNVGSGRECSIAELAGLLQKIIGYKGRIRWDDGSPNGQPRRLLSTDRMHAELGFVPHTDFEEGLRKTVAWYREKFLNGEKQ